MLHHKIGFPVTWASDTQIIVKQLVDEVDH